MFEDEMSEDHMAKTAEDYYRVNQHEVHEEKIAVMRAYIGALEAQVCILKHRQNQDTLALMAMR